VFRHARRRSPETLLRSRAVGVVRVAGQRGARWSNDSHGRRRGSRGFAPSALQCVFHSSGVRKSPGPLRSPAGGSPSPTLRSGRLPPLTPVTTSPPSVCARFRSRATVRALEPRTTTHEPRTASAARFTRAKRAGVQGGPTQAPLAYRCCAARFTRAERAGVQGGPTQAPLAYRCRAARFTRAKRAGVQGEPTRGPPCSMRPARSGWRATAMKRVGRSREPGAAWQALRALRDSTYGGRAKAKDFREPR
jgi:hypothetical protein